MEVHHHTHHPKKWKEYISEFFMLFMAVFAGFMAESYLEYRAERHKEHDYLVSLISDLKIDSADISIKEKNMNDAVNWGSKVSELVYKDNWMETYSDSIYIWTENMFATEIVLQYADGTIDQLKNAGGFRLIKNNNVSEKIKDYIKGQSRIKGQEEGVLHTFENLLAIKNNLLYAKVFSYEGDVLNGRSNITLLNEKLNLIESKTGSKFLSDNHSEFVKLSNTAMIYAGQLYVYRAMAISQKEKATELIKLIQEEIK